MARPGMRVLANIDNSVRDVADGGMAFSVSNIAATLRSEAESIRAAQGGEFELDDELCSLFDMHTMRSREEWMLIPPAHIDVVFSTACRSAFYKLLSGTASESLLADVSFLVEEPALLQLNTMQELTPELTESLANAVVHLLINVLVGLGYY